jgi:MFS family permease
LNQTNLEKIMLFKKDELKYLWPFYMEIFVSGLSTMIFPFIVFYYLGLGFSYFQISVIMAVYSGSMVLFEIPTGALADGFSRKYSVVLGLLIVASTIFLIASTKDFYVFVWLWAIVGMGTTFFSGAHDSWVFDQLNKLGRSDLQQEYFLKSSSFTALGSVLATFIGAIIVKFYAIKSLWYIYAFGFLISAIVLMLFTEESDKPQKSKSVTLLNKAYSNSKMGFAFSMRNKIFFYSMIAGIFLQLMFVGSIAMNPFLVSLGMAEYQVGYLSSILAIVAVIAPFISRLLVKFKPINAMSAIVLVITILLLTLLAVRPPYFIIVCIIEIVVSGLLIGGTPMLQTYINNVIPGKIRATTLSVKSMITQLVVTASSLVVGFLLDLFGPQKVLAWGGLFGILAIFFFRKMKND